MKKINEMLKTRPALNTAVGAVFAIIAGLLLLGYLSRLAGGSADGPLIDVPVARADIETGALISGQMITTRRVASAYMVPGTVRRRGDIKGARALRFIGKGEPFTSSAVSGRNSEGTLASRIPADLRAYTLQLGRGSGAVGLRAGDRVDVLATGGDPPQTGTLLRERLVLSVSGSDGSAAYDENPQASLSVTLLVSPREAEMLAQSECVGELAVSLCPLSPKKGR